MREWFINPVARYICEVNENGIGLTGNEIHVIEFAAYEALETEMAEALNERDSILEGHMRENLALKKENESLRREIAALEAERIRRIRDERERHTK